jgi:hypothetical protein
VGDVRVHGGGVVTPDGKLVNVVDGAIGLDSELTETSADKKSANAIHISDFVILQRGLHLL